MKLSPFAGKPAEPSMLVIVPRLITAYYAETPDPSVPAQRVAFGTSGHRGSSFDKAFNEWHILAISQAICLYRAQQNIDGPLFLGMDTHALSVSALASALEVLAANGVEVMLAEGDEYTPTPAISHASFTYNRGRKTGLADGIVITPSHNPPHDGGFKYNPPNGGPAESGVTGWIGAKANEFLENGLRGVKRIPFEKALHVSTTHRHDYLSAYTADLGNVIDMDAIRGAKISLGVDPLGGAGVHYWGPIAERYGLNLTVVNEAVDPTFRFMSVDWDGQIRMDPSSPYAMRRLIGLKDRFEIAFACDTDHDRHGIVTKTTGLLLLNHYLAVAIFYLFQHRPKWREAAAVTALRYWVVEMHVDGFRFDLAAVLGRGRFGNLLPNPPLLERIAEDPILRDVKIIAEAWDAAGAYEVGSFSERRWAEWNGQYRDDVRRFWRGDDGFLGLFAQRICGSADIYSKSGKGPESSINFVTCHDGFTLHDLVSYRQKHNEPNGQNNHDGTNENFSENYGAEGETADGQIESIRKRQIKNFLVTLLISRGVPMLLGGDEYRRTQGGNNNAYCQDNETSWHDWSCLEQHRDIFRFTRGMIAFRRAHPVLSKEQFYTDVEIQWFGPQGGLPNWADSKERQFACLIREDEQRALYLMFNAGAEAVDFGLPPVLPGARWHLAVDTSREAPQDLFAAGEESVWEDPKTYHMSPRSSAILLARGTEAK